MEKKGYAILIEINCGDDLPPQENFLREFSRGKKIHENNEPWSSYKITDMVSKAMMFGALREAEGVEKMFNAAFANESRIYAQVISVDIVAYARPPMGAGLLMAKPEKPV